MNRAFFAVSAMVVAVALSSCAVTGQYAQNAEVTKPQVDGHTSQNALDWQGTYKGVLPCASCEGISTQLMLSSNQTFSLKTQYLGKSDKTFVDSGRFVWAKDGRTITLNGIQYQVGENKLIQLDLEGNRITGALADNYILTKVVNMPIEDKVWKLVELNGQPVQGTAETHYLKLHSETKQVEAKAGCNAMFGGYEIKNQSQLTFKQMGSTMMACEDMAHEDAFSKVLTMADNFSISGDTMSLNRARMAPLARFELISLE
jgi:heat shock protein HslJ